MHDDSLGLATPYPPPCDVDRILFYLKKESCNYSCRYFEACQNYAGISTSLHWTIIEKGIGKESL